MRNRILDALHVVFICFYLQMTMSYSYPGLDLHNRLRDKHGAPRLVWSAELATLAQQYAQLLLQNQTFQHGMLIDTHGKRMGQNLAWGTSPTWHVDDAVHAWYDEGKKYNYSTTSFDPSTSHFTQLVWKSTTDVGIGVATNGTKTIVVANYSPPGNVNKHFVENVLSPH